MGLFSKKEKPVQDTRRIFVLDTSIFVDRRITALCEACLLEGRFVFLGDALRELQELADSGNYVTAKKGKKGMEALAEFREYLAKKGEIVEVVEQEFFHDLEVDDRLVAYCMTNKGILLTVDGNLSEVLRTKGGKVLNPHEIVHELTYIIRQGDQIELRLSRSGQVEGQAMGTFHEISVVVKDGAPYIGRVVVVIVRNVLKLKQGPLVFADFLYAKGK